MKKKPAPKRKARPAVGFPFTRPLRVTVNDKRVSIVDADGNVVSEIYPGQILGAVPSFERTHAIAAALVDAVNRRRG